MVNPHRDLVILRGWPHTEYANREYHFSRDERDGLLHCRLKSTDEMATLARGASFYRSDELPVSPEKGLVSDQKFRFRKFLFRSFSSKVVIYKILSEVVIL